MSAITSSRAAERFDARYWRATPHVFIKAHWGPQYCELCMDPRRRMIHLRDLPEEDPRRFWASMGRGYQVGRPGDHTWFRIDAWNDDGGSCSYGTNRHISFEGVAETARIMMLSGDADGRIYDHYLITEIYEHTVCDTNYHPVPEAEES